MYFRTGSVVCIRRGAPALCLPSNWQYPESRFGFGVDTDLSGDHCHACRLWDLFYPGAVFKRTDPVNDRDRGMKAT